MSNSVNVAAAAHEIQVKGPAKSARRPGHTLLGVMKAWASPRRNIRLLNHFDHGGATPVILA